MKKFNVIIFREGSWFRKYKEEWEVEANECFASNDGADFVKWINGSSCNGYEIVAAFKANKFTIISV